MIGITPAVFTFNGMWVDWPPYTFLPTTRLAYETGILRVPCVNKTTKAITANIIPISITSLRIPLTPSLIKAISLTITFGTRETIPTIIINEIPFPIPRSVILSPSHINNIVPVIKLTVPVKIKPKPGLITTDWPPADIDGRKTATIPYACIADIKTVR